MVPPLWNHSAQFEKRGYGGSANKIHGTLHEFRPTYCQHCCNAAPLSAPHESPSSIDPHFSPCSPSRGSLIVRCRANAAFGFCNHWLRNAFRNPIYSAAAAPASLKADASDWPTGCAWTTAITCLSALAISGWSALSSWSGCASVLSSSE